VERAGRLWAAVDILDGEVAPALIPADRLRYEAFVARVRADARFERHYQEGRRLAMSKTQRPSASTARTDVPIGAQ
jgi:hypothetical protein